MNRSCVVKRDKAEDKKAFAPARWRCRPWSRGVDDEEVMSQGGRGAEVPVWAGGMSIEPRVGVPFPLLREQGRGWRGGGGRGPSQLKEVSISRHGDLFLS
ncbi:MAG: hypothetical protein U0231_10475 [Nitrospiraceae bacterium]